ncbi:response regulator transcription factor [Corynebacterium hindlerae]|uniref:Response regulator transcription factor n=1 Tax=Corynebacterium hindlerae TaxID=699041 RepID=A0A7G5FCA6_9CORY|nr:response regulator transcription factor [Corynebacterium hindlerae]QMV84247.1 response regulator transcription factor [Corynebacterium hindlerae]
MNIVLADDSALLREGLAGLLERRGHTIVAQVSDADELLHLFDDAAAQPSTPDILITDVRMPPNMADDGLKAAVSLRAAHPNLAIMVLSQHVAPAYAVDLFAEATTAGTGYLLKDRVADVASFLQSLSVVADGGTVIDPSVASALMSAGRSGLGELTPREKEVLELMSRGLSNSEIATSLVISGAAVAKHVSNIFLKLRLPPEEENRRVKAILEYLTAT